MDSACSKLINIWGLTITAIFALFLIAFFIGFEAIWDRLQSMNEGTGAMLGAFLGLLAILTGAMFNAQLNRERDNRLLDEEKKSLAASLASEIFYLSRAFKTRGSFLKARYESHYQNSDKEYHSIETSLIPIGKTIVYESAGRSIGILGPQISGEIVRIYQLAHEFDSLYKATKIEKSSISDVSDDYYGLSEDADELANRLLAISHKNNPN